MKTSHKIIIGIEIVICAIIGLYLLSSSSLLSTQIPQGPYSYLSGWLFKIDVNGQDRYYLVVGKNRVEGGRYEIGTVLSKNEVEETINQNILPIETETGLTEEGLQDLKIKAGDIVQGNVILLGRDNIDKEVEEIKEPILKFGIKNNGGTEPWYYMVPVIGRNYCYLVEFDPNSGEFAKGGGCGLPKNFLVGNTGETIMQDYLVKTI
ncbi:hypothetical protein KY348_00220 [Candidatus Woesearchaeota archaeon]|nr:hypothetical protein [Candidatus Woesearchaeota archaeon]